jgi:hypothetical protein
MDPRLEGVLLGLLLVVLVWELGKPTFASAAGAYVERNAISYLPPAAIPVASVLGADQYASLLGGAVTAAMLSLP